MSSPVSIALAVVVAPFALLWILPLLSDLVSIAVSYSRLRKMAVSETGSPSRRLLIAVAAHNESGFIRGCIESLMAMERQRCAWDVTVVADNCADNTAELAREAGATVFERFDSEKPGKPAAIEWLLQQVDLPRYDAVVIVDADSTVDPGFADAYAAVPGLKGRAGQGYNDISNPGDTWLSLLGRLLIRVRYDGQYILKRRAGLNNPLTGNGMCVGMEVLERLGWSADSLTENWDMYARYTAAGVRIAFVPAAHIYSHESGTLADSTVRRHRWQAGRWHVLRRHAKALLGSRSISIHQKLDAMAEVASPGPVVQGAVATALAAGFALAPGTVAHTLAVLFGLAAAHVAAWTFFTWLRQPNRTALAFAFARMPIYVVWRLSIAARALTTAQGRRWEGSPRN